jgi:hypothetical protein
VAGAIYIYRGGKETVIEFTHEEMERMNANIQFEVYPSQKTKPDCEER